jgi:hypothetical protein
MGAQPDGSYALTGASLCFPMRWRLGDKLGRPMRIIHEVVPGFDERLAGPAERFFAAIEPERPVWRANWSLSDDPALHQPGTRFKPIEVEPSSAGERLHLRVERQTLRRLPRSRHVLFTIRTYGRPLVDVVALPGAAAALAAHLRAMPEPLLRYKNVLGIRAPLLAWLDRQAAQARPSTCER